MIFLMTGLSILWNGSFNKTQERENGLQEPNELSIPGMDSYHHYISDCLTFNIISPTLHNLEVIRASVIENELVSEHDQT